MIEFKYFLYLITRALLKPFVFIKVCFVAEHIVMTNRLKKQFTGK